MQEGWICPRCKKSLAPWVRECDCIEVRSTPEYNPWRTPQTGDPLSSPNYMVCGVE